MTMGIDKIFFGRELMMLLVDFPYASRVTIEAVSQYTEQFQMQKADIILETDEGREVLQARYDKTVCNIIKHVIANSNPHLKDQVEVAINHDKDQNFTRADVLLNPIQVHLRNVTKGSNLFH